MISMQEAIAAAKKHASEIYPNVLMDIRVEEIEQDNNEGVWNVTLGWFDRSSAAFQARGAIANITRPDNLIRIYKTFKVDETTSEVLSMKNALTLHGSSSHLN